MRVEGKGGQEMSSRGGVRVQHQRLSQHGMRAGAIKYAWPKRRGASEAQTEEITKDEATALNFALVEGSEEALE